MGKQDHPAKFAVSRDLVAAWQFGLSTQVLGEFFVNAQRKSTRPLLPVEAAAMVAQLGERPCAIVDQLLVRSAIDLSERFRISYWDAAIIAAAERLQAEVVYSEDFNHGQSYGRVRVVNPYL